jgi:hypothetical protein
MNWIPPPAFLATLLNKKKEVERRTRSKRRKGEKGIFRTQKER